MALLFQTIFLVLPKARFLESTSMSPRIMAKYENYYFSSKISLFVDSGYMINSPPFFNLVKC